MPWSLKTVFEPIKKSIFIIEIFSSEIEMKKIAGKLGNRICKKCRIWQSMMRWLRKTTFDPFKKSLFKIEIFSSKIEMKKISLELENRNG